MPFPLVTTFETAGTYKKRLWPNSAYITYMWHALLFCFMYLHTHIHIYIYIPHQLKFVSVSLARQLFLGVVLIILRLFYVSLTGANGERLTCSLPTASNTTTERKYERRTTHTRAHTHTHPKTTTQNPPQQHPLTFLHLRYQLGWLIKKYYCTVLTLFKFSTMGLRWTSQLTVMPTLYSLNNGK